MKVWSNLKINKPPGNLIEDLRNAHNIDNKP